MKEIIFFRKTKAKRIHYQQTSILKNFKGSTSAEENDEIHNPHKGRKAPKMVNMWINKKDFYHFKFPSTKITCSKQIYIYNIYLYILYIL